MVGNAITQRQIEIQVVYDALIRLAHLLVSTPKEAMSDFQHVLQASLARASAGPAFVDQQLGIVQKKLSSKLGENEKLKWQAAHRFLRNVWPLLERKHGYQTLYLHEVFEDVANARLDKTYKVDASLWRESRYLLNEEGERHALRTLWGENYKKAIYLRLANVKCGEWVENEYGFIAYKEMFKSTKILTSLTCGDCGELEWSLRVDTEYAKQFLRLHICGPKLREVLKNKRSNHKFSQEEIASMKWSPATKITIVQRGNVIWLAMCPHENSSIISLI